jgi:hypothetical protein
MKTSEVPHDLFVNDLFINDLFVNDLFVSDPFLSRLPLSRRFPGSRTPDNLDSNGLKRMVRLTPSQSWASRTMVRGKP